MLWLCCACSLGLSAPAAAQPQVRSEQGITMDFQEADIRAIIRFMSELTGVNYLVDNRVGGKVTIVTPARISIEEAQQVFESILEVQGFAVVSSGSIRKIVPISDAKQKGVEVRGGEEERLPESSDALVSQIIRLRYVDAAQLVPVLRPLVSPNSYLAAHGSSNTLILTDHAANVRRMLEIIQYLDAAEREQGVHLFRLRYAGPTRVADVLARLFPQTEKDAPAAKFLPDERTSTLVALSDARSYPRIRTVVEALDQVPSENTGYIQVYYLKNADADETAKVLTEMLKRPEGLAKDEGLQQGFTRPVSVMADKATNALLINADPHDYEVLRRVIDKLDIRRLQVYVEALILEVSADRSREFGIEWRALDDFTSPDADRSPFGGTRFDNLTGGINALAVNPLTAGNGLSLGIVDGVITFRGQTFANIGALIRALAQETDVNVLSTPNLLTMDNEEAEIMVGQNVPLLTGTVPTQDGVATPFQTIVREDIGIKLRILPQISEGDTVRLGIYQEISNLVAATINNPQGIITNKRSIKTTVSVREGQMIALGGLIQDDTTTSVSKVPVLGDLPLLGTLFRADTKTKSKTNLMVFLRPQVIRSPGEIEQLSREKYGGLAQQSPVPPHIAPAPAPALAEPPRPPVVPERSAPPAASPIVTPNPWGGEWDRL